MMKKDPSRILAKGHHSSISKFLFIFLKEKKNTQLPWLRGSGADNQSSKATDLTGEGNRERKSQGWSESLWLRVYKSQSEGFWAQDWAMWVVALNGGKKYQVDTEVVKILMSGLVKWFQWGLWWNSEYRCALCSCVTRQSTFGARQMIQHALGKLEFHTLLSWQSVCICWFESIF